MRALTALTRRALNRKNRRGVRPGVTAARTAADGSDPAEATNASRRAEGLLRRAASKGVIPKKRASRRVSRLARRANQVAAD